MHALRELRLQNFKCFKDHSILLGEKVVVVGKNNAGKSTIVEALLLLSVVVNRKGFQFTPPPAWTGLGRYQRCITPSIDNLALNTTTLFTHYGEPPAILTARFDNGVIITVYVGREERVCATIQSERNTWVTTRAQLMGLGIANIHVLPQVGPLLADELLLTESYVKSKLGTRLSPLHFRNQLVLMPERFQEFKSLAEQTWHGLRVQPIERTRGREGTALSLLVQDGNFVAEVAWMGHGLQMWLQTIWFLSWIEPHSTVVLDEPDVYMHPDLQRKLFRLASSRCRQTIVATHSVEIMAEVEPSEILVVEPFQKTVNIRRF